MLKRIITIGLLMSSFAGIAQIVNLPKVNVGGKQFYQYKASKGDSEYGICKTLGWNAEVIHKYNPTLTSPFKKGELIYYPVGEEVKSAPSAPFNHTIKKGETVYSIAHSYNLTPEDIYAMNPEAKFGIKADDVIIIPGKSPAQKPILSDASTSVKQEEITHVIKSGETLYGLAKQFDTTVEDIMKLNPGVSESSFKADSKIQLLKGSRYANLVRELQQRDVVSGFKSYKVGKNEGWKEISKKTGVEESLLRSSNPGVTELMKGELIAVPITETKQVEAMVPVVDPRESSVEGRQEIFEEVQESFKRQAKASNVRVAVLLDNIESNKDSEFLRGFVAGINNFKDSNFKINVKGLELKSGEADIVAALNSFEPDLIITTTEKDTPQYILDYGKSNICYVVSVFDSKLEDYVTNPMVVQVLTPTPYFNAEVTDYIYSNFGDYRLIVAGEAESADLQLESIFKSFDPAKVQSIDIQELADYDTSDGAPLLIYGTPTNKSEIKDLVDKIGELQSKSPLTKIVTIGRPNWITVMDTYKQSMGEVNTYIPSRFFFDSSTNKSRVFIDEFKNLYNHTPMKSFPVYSATGYDTANYFIQAMHESGGNLSSESAKLEGITLQNAINLKRPEIGEGLYNSTIYLLHIDSMGNIEKIELK